MRLWSDVRLTSSNCSQNADLFSFKRYILWNKVSSPFLTKYNYNLIIKTAIFIFMGFAELFISLFFLRKDGRILLISFFFFNIFYLSSLYDGIILQIMLKEFHSMQDRRDFSLHKTLNALLWYFLQETMEVIFQMIL